MSGFLGREGEKGEEGSFSWNHLKLLTWGQSSSFHLAVGVQEESSHHHPYPVPTFPRGLAEAGRGCFNQTVVFQAIVMGLTYTAAKSLCTS